MKVDRNTIQQIGLFLSKDGAMSAARVLVGVMLGATIGETSGVVAVGAISAGVVALTGLAHYTIERQKKEDLLDTYREEISNLLGKDEKQLTIGDLEKAAVAGRSGQGSQALRMALDYFKDTRNFYIGSQAITAGLMVAGLSFVSSMFNVPTIGLAGAAGLLYNEMFRTVTSIGSLMFEGNIEGTITKDIRTIAQQISLGGRISSTRVLGVLVTASPELQGMITERFQQPYEELSIADKRKAVNALDDKTGVIGLTRDINAGRVLPTELAFVAFNEHSGTPRRAEVPEEHMEHDHDNATRWAARVHSNGVQHTPMESYVSQLDIDEDAMGASVQRVH